MSNHSSAALGGVLRTTVLLPGLVLLAVLLAPRLVAAQTMEQPKAPEVGDKATYAYVLMGEPYREESEITAVTDEEIHGVESRDGITYVTYEVAFTKAGAKLLRGPCFSNLQACRFTPGINRTDFPLQKGKKWTTTFRVKAETFNVQTTQERRVDKIEKIKVPAGEFETYKISYSGRIADTNVHGTEDGAEWFTVVSGKLCLVKVEYHNSIGEVATMELTSVSFK